MLGEVPPELALQSAAACLCLLPSRKARWPSDVSLQLGWWAVLSPWQLHELRNKHRQEIVALLMTEQMNIYGINEDNLRR